MALHDDRCRKCERRPKMFGIGLCVTCFKRMFGIKGDNK